MVQNFLWKTSQPTIVLQKFMWNCFFCVVWWHMGLDDSFKIFWVELQDWNLVVDFTHIKKKVQLVSEIETEKKLSL